VFPLFPKGRMAISMTCPGKVLFSVAISSKTVLILIEDKVIQRNRHTINVVESIQSTHWRWHAGIHG
jgi:hypothetical protein